MKLRSRVRGVPAERLEEISEGKKFSDIKVIHRKENVLNKKCLRAQNKSGSEKISSNQNLKKISRRNNKSEDKIANCAVKLDSEEKENKMKKRPQKAVSDNCLKIKSCSSISPTILLERNTCTLENRKKVTEIMNSNSNLVGKKYIPQKRNIESKKVNNEVPLCEISNDCRTGITNINNNLIEQKYITRRNNIKSKKINDEVSLHELSTNCSVIVSDKRNRFINETDARSQDIINHTKKFPVWRKKAIINNTRCSIKRKNLVDVYDISQDEDMSNEPKQKKKKINPKKIVKKTVRNKGFTISNKNTNFNQKYPNILKPVHNRINKIINDQSDHIGSNPPTVKVNTTVLSSDKKLEVISTDIVEENDQNCGIDTDDLNATSEHVDIDLTCTGTKSQEDAKHFLLHLADELENSFIKPRMTSTPDTTLLNNPVTNHLPSSKLIGLNISSVIPQTKNCFKVPVKVCNSFSDKVGDITLFESPVKKPQKKDHVKLKSPKKNIQIDLFNNFTEQSEMDDLENSVLEPKKAYHSPDNFKTHLARTKRISEVIKRDAIKTKEDKMIEKMAQHFEEISSTELTIE